MRKMGAPDADRAVCIRRGIPKGLPISITFNC
jgi:hypothetical protein